MKFLSNICAEVAESLKSTTPIICEYVAVPGGIVRLKEAVLSTEKTCEWCMKSACYCPLFDPKTGADRVWLCANLKCEVNKRLKHGKAYQMPVKPVKALEWPLFCEINNIGDVYHDVKFESIEQSEAKMSFLLKFASSPRGLIFMRGDTGTGKTYASMGVCEFYTRQDASCVFTTAKNLSKKWIQSFDKNVHCNYLDGLKNCKLLVIDDFGTGEPNVKFLEFFMELINSRMQWKEKGTIITTNLEVTKFNEFCGDALADRIMTGQIFEFVGKSRRKKLIL